jgi:hypothetical protein
MHAVRTTAGEPSKAAVMHRTQYGIPRGSTVSARQGDNDRRRRGGDRFSAPRATDPPVALACVIDRRVAASSANVEPEDSATAAETRATTPHGADDPTLQLEGGENFHDALDRESRPLGDAVHAQSVCPNTARDGMASRRLVTRVGHGRPRGQSVRTRLDLL